MNLWILSQNKKVYEKVDKVCVVSDTMLSGDYHYIESNNGTQLGMYKTEERAMEVLADIMWKREFMNLEHSSYKMPEE